MVTILSIQVGEVAPLGPEGVPSGFRKSSVTGPVKVRRLGITGDEQADLRVHGGPEKAVYASASEHYSAWAKDFPEHQKQLVPGGFGENLTVSGMLEADLCVGDKHRIGTALLQVCQPRQPCFKLSLFFDDNRLPKAMVRNGRAGWYYRVLEEGEFEAGDTVRLEDRPHPDFPFARLISIVNFGDASPAELHAMAEMEGLAARLRDRARAILSST